jgi:hypothetical protein
MGHYLPVFFCPINASEAVGEFLSWNDGVHLMEPASALCASSTLTKSTDRKEISKSTLYGRPSLAAPESGPDFLIG